MKRLDTAVLRQFRQAGRPLAVAAPETSSFPVRVVQFGEGNFLRAFVDWMFDQLNRRGLFNGRVRIVQPLPTGLVEALNEQDGLYTVMLRGLLNGRPVEQTHLITSVAGGLNPYSDWRGFLALAANPDLRFVVSNTTEAGIAYVAEPMPTDKCPESFPAKVTMFLFERYRRLGGMAQSGLLILWCFFWISHRL